MVVSNFCCYSCLIGYRLRFYCCCSWGFVGSELNSLGVFVPSLILMGLKLLLSLAVFGAVF